MNEFDSPELPHDLAEEFLQRLTDCLLTALISPSPRFVMMTSAAWYAYKIHVGKHCPGERPGSYWVEWFERRKQMNPSIFQYGFHMGDGHPGACFRFHTFLVVSAELKVNIRDETPQDFGVIGG